MKTRWSVGGVTSQPFYQTDGGTGGGTGGDGGTGTGDGRDAAYWQAEAKKAFADRDKAKRDAAALQSRALSEDDAKLFTDLKAQREKDEEDRAKKAGEFENLKKTMADKHERELKAKEKEIADRDATNTSLSNRFKDTVRKAEFGAATEYFGGGETSRTILDVEMAIAFLGKFVVVEDSETDPRGFTVTVKDPRGNTILGKDGNPAPFVEALGELINQLPNKDRILRGSGKTGSGSSGGSGHAANAADVTELTKRAAAGDKDALEALRKRRGAPGSLQMGSALTR